MLESNAKTGKSTFLGKVITQLIALLVFLVIPAIVTAVAPVSWVKFQRQGDRVTARAEVCLFFIIPFRTLTVDPVTGVDDRTKAGSITRHRRPGTDKFTQAETQGFLSIEGPNSTAEVSITPHDLESVKKKAEDFLKDPKVTELKLFVVANWKFSVIAGGLATLFAALYVFGVAGATVMFVLRTVGLVKKAEAAKFQK